MSDSEENLKLFFEKKFHIEFNVEEDLHEHISNYKITAVNSDFFINIEFKNNMRVSVDLGPKRTSYFTKSLKHDSVTKRKNFTNCFLLLKSKGCKVNISVNNQKISAEDYDTWPADWEFISLHVTKILSESDFDYESVVKDIGGLTMSLLLSLAEITPDEKLGESYFEGGFIETTINRYERNPINRRICLENKGYKCEICGFDFEKYYGDIGHNFIHVHHIVPISAHQSEYVLNPLTDLIPVCPNCHSMLHQRNPPFTPSELKEIIKRNHVTK